MNYAIEQRLRLIDFLFDHYGYVRREMIMDYYGVSIAQVSLDFKRYQELAPDNLKYNTSAKYWERTQAFVRVYKPE